MGVLERETVEVGIGTGEEVVGVDVAILSRHPGEFLGLFDGLWCNGLGDSRQNWPITGRVRRGQAQGWGVWAE